MQTEDSGPGKTHVACCIYRKSPHRNNNNKEYILHRDTHSDETIKKSKAVVTLTPGEERVRRAPVREV